MDGKPETTAADWRCLSADCSYPNCGCGNGMPMVLRGAKLHAELNREYEGGFRDGSRSAAAITAGAMLLLAVVIFGGGWLMWRL